VKYAVVTFGCRVNQADSLGFEEELLATGATPASTESADLVIVNTCSVTASADQGARQTIRRIARDNPHARIVVTGCYATRRPEEIRALPNVETVIGNDDKPRLLQLITKHVAARAEQDAAVAAVESAAGGGPCGAAIEPGVAGRTAFTLRVQTGCAEPCSYCIIPSTRGAPRSLPIADVLREIDRVVAAGFKEVALTGVHLGSYGRDLMPRSSFIDLLQAVRDTDGVPTASALADRSLLFRISSLEPADCSREIVDLVAASDCFAPHFHLPLQHASDRVLAAMRRPYRIADYAQLVDDIRARVAHAAIGTDVIVGFPGETEDDFRQLAADFEASPVTHVHVFPYSDRPGTAASRLGGRAPGTVVRERARVIREISGQLAARFRESQLGTIHRALTLDDGTVAVTGNYLKLHLARGHERNEWVNVRVSAGGGGSMNGEVAERD
jgi:threonylcarbamoyladenosine tRNA methylthiotransferase MtaB